MRKGSTIWRVQWGVPLYADAAIESQRRISYARICVEVDASKSLLNEFIIDVMETSNPNLVRDEIDRKSTRLNSSH